MPAGVKTTAIEHGIRSRFSEGNEHVAGFYVTPLCMCLQVYKYVDFKAAVEERKCILAPWAPDSKIEGDVKIATTVTGAHPLLHGHLSRRRPIPVQRVSSAKVEIDSCGSCWNLRLGEFTYSKTQLQ